MWRQPKAVWAVAFACVIAFMGIGLVDPILKPIADDLGASPSQVSLLFTSYMAVMGVAMLITGGCPAASAPSGRCSSAWRSSSSAPPWPGMSDSVGGIVGLRAVWGLGNALFIATALATIVSAARGSVGQAIILYEAALGLGIAAGPLVGGVLGSISWRGPFFGVAVLMAIALLATAFVLPATPAAGTADQSLAEPFRALRHRGLLGRRADRAAVQLRLLHAAGLHARSRSTWSPHQIGLIFFGWGAAARRHVGRASRRCCSAGSARCRRLARRRCSAFAAILAVMAIWTDHKPCWSSAWSSPGRSSASTTP